MEGTPGDVRRPEGRQLYSAITLNRKGTEISYLKDLRAFIKCPDLAFHNGSPACYEKLVFSIRSC